MFYYDRSYTSKLAKLIVQRELEIVVNSPEEEVSHLVFAKECVLAQHMTKLPMYPPMRLN